MTEWSPSTLALMPAESCADSLGILLLRLLLLALLWRLALRSRLTLLLALRSRLALLRSGLTLLLLLALRSGLTLLLLLALRSCLTLLLLLALRSCLTLLLLLALRSCLTLLLLLALRSCLTLLLALRSGLALLLLPLLRNCLALVRLALLTRLMLLLSNSPIGCPQRRWGPHVAICRKRPGDGHTAWPAVVDTRKLSVVGAGSTLILDLRPHRRSMLLVQRRQLRGPRSHPETARSAVVTHTGAALIVVHGAVVNVLRA
jgi:hypothetical protein